MAFQHPPKEALVLGAGLSGATVARVLADDGWLVTVVESRHHVAGNCYDYVNDLGIRVCKYGAHIFHTSKPAIVEFLSRYTQWVPYRHRVRGLVRTNIDDRPGLVNVPADLETIEAAGGVDYNHEYAWASSPEERSEAYEAENTNPNAEATSAYEGWIGKVGYFLYNLLFDNYTVKQWGRSARQLSASLAERVNIRKGYDWSYFKKTEFQGLPKDGYTTMIKNMLTHQNINVKLSTTLDLDQVKQWLAFEGQGTRKVILTGRIDTFFKNEFGPLEYRHIKFIEERFSRSLFYQPLPVVNYCQLEHPRYKRATRTVEPKHFPNQPYGHEVEKLGTVVIHEESTDNEGVPAYPVNNEANKERFEKYKRLARDMESIGFHCTGRNADYKYYNMDQAVEAALALANKLKSN